MRQFQVALHITTYNHILIMFEDDYFQCTFRDSYEVVEITKKQAKMGDAEDVLRVIDDYCWKEKPMMNVGDIKGTCVCVVCLQCVRYIIVPHICNR